RTLLHSDRNEIRDKEEELEYDIDMPQADPNHLSLAAINGILVKELNLITYIANKGQPLPGFATIDYITTTWTKLLRHAYRYDYGAPPDYPPVFNEHRKIQFSHKLAFTDRYVPRVPTPFWQS
ncbi:hypothetical protein OFB65_24855, partial [Escherichia coli]|nr:hypothetical protein [Escherichia coli]